MITKEDVMKMEVKDTKAKRTENAVYGTLNKNSNFHELGLYQVNSKTLSSWFEDFDMFKLSQSEKIQILKEVLLAQQQELETIKIILAKYGME